jgi:NitT/TauT family transport system permease protein
LKAQPRTYAVLVGTAVIFVLLWWYAALAKNNEQQFAGPLQTAQALGQIFSSPSLSSQVASALGTTLTSVIFAFALAVGVGVPIGVLMGRYAVADLFLDPWVNAWYAIPAIAFVPLMMNWTGLTSESTILIAFLIAVFSIILNVYAGVKNTSSSLVETARSYNASGAQVIAKVILPSSMPSIVLGLRVGLVRAIEGVIIAEMFFVAVGIGSLIDNSADHLQSALSNALIIILVIVALSINEAAKYIGRRVVAWKESESIAA